MDLSKIKTKFKNKQDLVFLTLGILMSLLVFTYVFLLNRFLALKIKEVLNAGKLST